MFVFRRYIFVFFLCLFGISENCIRAQTLDADELLTKSLDSDELLPLLIEAAINFSPQVKRVNNTLEIANSSLKINKNLIYNGLALSSSYHYGTNYSAINSSTALQNTLTTSQTGFYNVGVAFQLPITSIINRKHTLKTSQAQINIALAEQENINLAIKQDIITQYQELKLAKKLLAISRSSLQSAQTNHLMAEKQFLQNQIAIDQSSRVFEVYNKAKVEYETALNRFQTIFMQLEASIGGNLTTLLKQIK